MVKDETTLGDSGFMRNTTHIYTYRRAAAYCHAFTDKSKRLYRSSLCPSQHPVNLPVQFIGCPSRSLPSEIRVNWGRNSSIHT